MTKYKGFFAYSASPREIGDVIEAAAENVFWGGMHVGFSTWRALDIAGHFIAEAVTDALESAEFVVADLTRLNFNVTYEIGFAIGRSKRVILVRNVSIVEAGARIQDVGLFDTLGYEDYQNSTELRARIDKLNELRPIDFAHPLNQKAPVYLVEPTHKTDWVGRIVSRIKKAGYIYRSFDPNESPRLSAYEAIAQVSQSYGVVVPLLGDVSAGADIHNMRAAFIAGLAHGMEKAVWMFRGTRHPCSGLLRKSRGWRSTF